MRIGILTSWRVPCGIYQYSARLADAFKQIGHEPVILAGRADEHRSVPEESEHEVHDAAHIGMWRDDGAYSLDALTIWEEYNLDALHVQYQSMLFNQNALESLAICFHNNRGPTAVTFHDNCQDAAFPYNAFDLKFTHRRGVGPPDAEVIPFGIEDRPPIVRSFGLGRSQSDLIRPLCEEKGWIFEDASSHEPIFGGGQGWKSHEDLIQWLRGADAIVLWYPDTDMAGSSQAARTAMASRRPVFTNNTTWFKDLPDYVTGGTDTTILRKVHNLDQLQRMLTLVFARPYVDPRSWTAVATQLVHRYQAISSQFPIVSRGLASS